MYGLGFVARSVRYTSSADAAQGAVYRCESTIWNASPARMYSLAASTCSR